MSKRVVITGVGVVTPVGFGRDVFWNNIKSGFCGIDSVTRFDVSSYDCQIAGEVKDFDIENYMDKKEAKRTDLFVQYAVAAAKMAAQDAGLGDDIDPYRIGVVVGSGIGGMNTFEEQYKIMLQKGPGRVSPFFIPMMISNMATGRIAIIFGAKGFNATTVSACASSTSAAGEAFYAIGRGDADVIFTGGSEAAITPLSFAGFCAMKAMSSRNDNPKRASIPFDLERDGFVMGEGAGILIFEELEHAKRRGAKIIAEVVGYASTNDAYHITAPIPGGEGAASCMQLAIEHSGLQPCDIDYINAHGTSTPYNDKYETMAIKSVFGEHAKKLAISSTKSMMGHLLGAAGAVEAIVSALAILEGYVPPTIGYLVPDPECDLDYVVNQGRYMNINYAISNSLGFGGHNSTIVLKRYILGD